MDMHLVATHFDVKNNLIGFRILDADSGEVKDYKYSDIRAAMLTRNVHIYGIECNRKEQSIMASNGNFERYTRIVNGRTVREAVVILYSIDDVGYRVSNGQGKTAYALTSEVIKTAEKVGIANGKVVDNGNSKYISAIRGGYKNIEVDKTPLKERVLTGSNLEKRKSIVDPVKLDEIERVKQRKREELKERIEKRKETEEKLFDDDSGMTVEQKVTYAINAIKNIKPFCYTVLTCIEVSYDWRNELSKSNTTNLFDCEESPFFVTMNKLVINSEVVRDIPTKYLIFMILKTRVI